MDRLPPSAGLHQPDIDALTAARHADPFALLGPHRIDGVPYVRALLPNAHGVRVIARGMPGAPGKRK